MNLCRFLEPAGLVLDLGCGPGRLTFEMARRHPEATFLGVDFSGASITEAHRDVRRPHNTRFVTNDGHDLTWPTQGRQFQAAYAVTVFQHLPHDVTAHYVRQIGELLEPGGRLMFTHAVGGDDLFMNHQCEVLDAEAWVRDAGLIWERDFWDLDWWWVGARKP